MADKKTRPDLEILFSSGKIPTQSNFADLIASGVNQKDDGLQKASDTPLKIQAPVTVAADPKAPKDLILFYEKFEDAAKWRMGTRSGSFEISRVDQSDFLLDAKGNVGIGTTKPLSELSISSVKAQADSLDQKIGELTFVGFDRTVASASILAQSSTWDDQSHLIFKTSDSSAGAKERLRITNDGNVGIGTNDPKSKLHVVASGGFGTENADGISGANRIPIVAQSNSTAIGIINGSGRPAFAIDIVSDGGTKTARGVVSFIDRYDGNWHTSLSLKNGNVGIGTTPSDYPLDVLGKMQVKDNGTIEIPGSKNTFNGMIETSYNDNGKDRYGIGQLSGGAMVMYTSESWAASSIQFGQMTGTDSFKSQMTIDHNGNVGIGTTKPLGTLSVGDSAVDGSNGFIVIGKRSGGGTRHHRIGFDDAFNFVIGDYGYSNTAATWTSQFAMSYAAPDKSFYINSSGYVGIGTKDPRVPLDIRGNKVFPLNDSPDGFGPNTGFTNWGDRGTNFNLSVLAENWVGGAGFVANSDRRIKEIAGLSDTAKDLEIIQKIRVTDYRPVDKMAEGDSLRRGFIAQEVLKVFPQAVGSRTNLIPDIYSNPTDFAFDEKQKTLSVTMPKPHALTKGQVVQILTEDGAKTATVVAVPTNDSFVADNFEKEPRDVFVFGRQVDDFLTVNYDQIFSTGIGAIQELNKIVASKDAELKDLHRLFSAQDERLAKLEAKEKSNNESRAAGVGSE